MKLTKKFILAASALLVSFGANAHAHMMQYNLNLVTTAVEGSAFGGVSIGNVFQGSMALDTHKIQQRVDDDGGFATIILPLTSYDFDTDTDVFNLSYSINIGDYDFTQGSSDVFDSEFTVDDPANVQNITKFVLDTGDASFDDLLISYIGSSGTWSATDGDSFNVVSGTFTVSSVPVPAAVWMFGSGLIGLVGLKRKKS